MKNEIVGEFIKFREENRCPAGWLHSHCTNPPTQWMMFYAANVRGRMSTYVCRYCMECAETIPNIKEPVFGWTALTDEEVAALIEEAVIHEVHEV